MTKDGRPSLLCDIRHFIGITRRESTHLKSCEDAVAFGRRLAWLLNGEGVSLGAYSAMYLLFTSSIEPDAIQVTDEGGDWWQRYTYVGVPREFPEMPNASSLVIQGTTTALKAIRPDLGTTIDAAADVAAKQHENLRFLLKTRETKRFLVEFRVAFLNGRNHLGSSFHLPTGQPASTLRRRPPLCASTPMLLPSREQSGWIPRAFNSCRIHPLAQR